MMQLLRSVFPVKAGKRPRRGLTPARCARRQGFVACVCRAVLLVGLCASVSLFAQQNQYAGANITGIPGQSLSLTRVVNLSSAPLTTEEAPIFNAPNLTDFSKLPSQFLPPPLPQNTLLGGVHTSGSTTQSLSVVPALGFVSGFNGLTHYDQRNANGGNQLNQEPPNPSIAVANGFILEGVNNAVRVFSASGTPLLSPVASNQLFGVTAAYDRSDGVLGVYPTDMRVFYDSDISRWFVLQRSQDNTNDVNGDPLSSSHIYLAVSQTADPTGNYNIYVMDTTDSTNLNQTNGAGCPCVADFPQIGADRYGFYISANEYSISPDPSNPSPIFVDATILAISKQDLAGGASAPTAPRTVQFIINSANPAAFAIQPATAPQGGSQFLANGGVEFLVSSISNTSSNQLFLWALSNTASLQSANPSLLLTQTAVSMTLYYGPPGNATQKPGPLPYACFLFPSPYPCLGLLAYLDGGDSRILSAAYAAGQLFVTLQTEVTDKNGNILVGGLYAIISPTFSSTGFLAGAVGRQGFLVATGEHILRPAVAVNPEGFGAIGFTLVGPDYFPSAAFVQFEYGPKMASGIQIGRGGAGAAPEDGFTGYPGNINYPNARWGDYSTATYGGAGTIWMVSEYIPNGPPASNANKANWGTFLSQYVP